MAIKIHSARECVAFNDVTATQLFFSEKEKLFSSKWDLNQRRQRFNFQQPFGLARGRPANTHVWSIGENNPASAFPNYKLDDIILMDRLGTGRLLLVPTSSASDRSTLSI